VARTDVACIFSQHLLESFAAASPGISKLSPKPFECTPDIFSEMPRLGERLLTGPLGVAQVLWMHAKGLDWPKH
jgi:hypothetical protein